MAACGGYDGSVKCKIQNTNIKNEHIYKMEVFRVAACEEGGDGGSVCHEIQNAKYKYKIRAYTNTKYGWRHVKEEMEEVCVWVEIHNTKYKYKI